MRTVPAPHGVRVEVTADNVEHLCPFEQETDRGAVDATWHTTDHTVELHDYCRFVRSFADDAISHEELVQCIFDNLTEEGVDPVRVTWRGITAGLTVTVSATSEQGTDALLRQPLNAAGA